MKSDHGKRTDAMPITVKKLIAELEKVDNKYLEVEVFLNPDCRHAIQELDNRVSVQPKKVLLYTK
jgi:uncharacterized protein (UPF0212 family)